MTEDIPEPAAANFGDAGSEPRHEKWLEWVRTRSLVLRDELADYYLPLARIVAGRVYRLRVDSAVPFDDYLQYARIGLLESLERFDPDRGTPFRAFAFHRIRGAILNGLARESDLAAQREASRRVSRERRESLLEGASSGGAQSSLSELIELTVGLALGALLDEGGEVADESPQANPYASAEMTQMRHLAWTAVGRLPQREQELIRAHYVEQREFRDIAKEWALSTGRISQLHARAMRQLRQLLKVEPTLNRRL